MADSNLPSKFLVVTPRWSKKSLQKLLTRTGSTGGAVLTWAEFLDTGADALTDEVRTVITLPRHRCNPAYGGNGETCKAEDSGFTGYTEDLRDKTRAFFEAGGTWIVLVPGQGFFDSVPREGVDCCVCPPKTLRPSNPDDIQFHAWRSSLYLVAPILSSLTIKDQANSLPPFLLEHLRTNTSKYVVPDTPISAQIQDFLCRHEPFYYLNKLALERSGFKVQNLAHSVACADRVFVASFAFGNARVVILPCQNAQTKFNDINCFLDIANYMLKQNIEKAEPAIDNKPYIISFVNSSKHTGDFYINGKLVIGGKLAKTQIKVVKVLFDTFDQATDNSVPYITASDIAFDIEKYASTVGKKLELMRIKFNKTFNIYKPNHKKILDSRRDGWRFNPVYVSLPSDRRQRSPR